MSDPVTSVSVHLTPRTTISIGDLERDGERHTSLHLGNEIELCFCDDFGDVGIVAVLGELIDRLELLRRNARGRMAAQYTGLPALPDAVEPATLADALRGWAPGEITEAYGR